MASTNPGVENVRAGVQYTIDDVEFTGTLVLPDPADVRDGEGFGKDGTEFEGSLDLPAVEDVRDGTEFDGANAVGTLELPAQSDVKEGVEYGADGTEFTGSYVPDLETAVESLERITAVLNGQNICGIECVLADASEVEDGCVTPAKPKVVRLIQGESKTLIFQLINKATGKPISLTGASSIQMLLPSEEDPADPVAITGSVVQGVQGQLQFPVLDENSALVNPSDDKQDFEIRYVQLGEQVILPMKAKLLVSAPQFPLS